MKQNENKLFITRTLVGFLFTIVPAFFTSYDIIAGFCGILGLFFYVCASKILESKKQGFVLLGFMWLSYTIRYYTLLGTDFKSFLIMAALYLPAIFLFGLGILTEHRIHKKGHPFIQTIAFPVFYTLFHIGLVTIGLGNQTNVFIVFMNIYPLNLCLSFMGEIGLTFLFGLIFSLFSNSLVYRKIEGNIVSFAFGFTFLCTLVFIGCVISMEEKPEDYTLNVAVAVREKMDLYGNTERDYTKAEHFAIFENSLKEAAAQKADLLLCNEEYCDVLLAQKEEDLNTYSQIIKKYQIPVLMGVNVETGTDEKNTNEAIFFDKDGNILGEYVKNNLVPFVETSDYVNGEESPGVVTCTLGGHEVNIAYVICFDFNDSFYMQKIPENTELLLVPAWDWDDNNLEQKNQWFRSIEVNTTLIHHCYEGFTFVSGPYGLCGDIVDFRGVYETVRMIQVPIWEKED